MDKKTITKNLIDLANKAAKILETAQEARKIHGSIVVETLAHCMQARLVLTSEEVTSLRNNLVEQKTFAKNTVDVYFSTAKKVIKNTKIKDHLDDKKQNVLEKLQLIEVVNEENIKSFRDVRNYDKGEVVFSKEAIQYTKACVKLGIEASLISGEEEEEKAYNLLIKIADKIDKFGK